MSESSDSKLHWSSNEENSLIRSIRSDVGENQKNQVDDGVMSDASENKQRALQSSAKKRKFNETDADAADQALNTRSKMVSSPPSSMMPTYLPDSSMLIGLKIKPFGMERNEEKYDFRGSHGMKRGFTPESESVHSDDTTDHEEEWSSDLQYIEEVKFDDGEEEVEGVEGQVEEDVKRELGEEVDGEAAEEIKEEIKEEVDEEPEDKEKEGEEAEEDEEKENKAPGSTTPTSTPKSSTSFSGETASATVTGSSPAPAAGMAIKAGVGAGALPLHVKQATGISLTTGGAQTPDGWPRGYRSLSQPTANLGVSTHPHPTVRCVAASHNGTGTPTSYQHQNVSFASTTSYQPANTSFTSETHHVNNWTAINKSTVGNTPTSWQPLQDSFTRAQTSLLLAAEPSLYKGLSELITRPTTEKANAVETPTSHQVQGRSSLRINLSSLVGSSQAPEYRLLGPPVEGDVPSRATTFGEILEMFEHEKEAEHLEIEEEIRGLEQQIEILREQSKAAKSQSVRAGELLDRLHLPGGWADLNAFEVFDLISGVVGPETDEAGGEPKTF
ncbi:hypothetical protein BJX66DRAFT_341833 [Aspergillus keveii]|uniref:Uncharacterized protein n=1 Tax=Aspergillus keveii TaxID=714993 RepID=A0ABR4FU53_9EURO